MAQRFSFETAYQDYSPVLARPDVDAVFLLTHYQARREVILAAAAAGKHVFTQKPLAGSVAEGEALTDAAERGRIRLVTSFMHNYFPETRLVKRLLDERRIGALELIRQRNATHNLPQRAAELGGATRDIGPHGIAMIHHLTGTRIARVQAMLDVSDPRVSPGAGRTPDTIALINYRLSDGTLAHHQVHWTAHAGSLAWSTELYGKGGGILLRPSIGDSTVDICHVGDEQIGTVPAGARRIGTWEPVHVEPEVPSGLFQHQLFIDDVRFDRHESVPNRAGLDVLRVVDAIYRSAQSGTAISL